MLTSIALLLLMGLLLGRIFRALHLPSLIGMIITGILLGPYVLNWIDSEILSLSGELRQIALVIILTRAGLSLELSSLKKVGSASLLMSFLPATFEIISITILAPLLLGMDTVSAMILGSVLAAISPAVVVPRMLKLMDEGYGNNYAVPQLIISGSSLDDVFVIVLFTVFASLSASEGIQFSSFLRIPVSIILGILLGVVIGIIFVYFSKMFHMRDSVKITILLSISFFLLEIENILTDYIPISGLLAIMAMGTTIHYQYPLLAKRFSLKYDQLWVVAEIILFVLVGASLNISYVGNVGIKSIVLIILALGVRMLGVYFSIIKTDFPKKEKLFTILAYTPKATVQAAIGGIPLAMGLPFGEEILAISIVAILLTAPLGAFLIDSTYKKLLSR
ncbi:MAG TPA: cation:proton antiporter [Candidatus Jeotgalibaca pullicola]|nr:cation:proton antiporter [Candidatus Jeotgalibaca pullicola]